MRDELLLKVINLIEVVMETQKEILKTLQVWGTPHVYYTTPQPNITPAPWTPPFYVTCESDANKTGNV